MRKEVTKQVTVSLILCDLCNKDHANEAVGFLKRIFDGVSYDLAESCVDELIKAKLKKK